MDTKNAPEEIYCASIANYLSQVRWMINNTFVIDEIR